MKDITFTCPECGKEVLIAAGPAQKAGLTCYRSTQGIDHKPRLMNREEN